MVSGGRTGAGTSGGLSACVGARGCVGYECVDVSSSANRAKERANGTECAGVWVGAKASRSVRAEAVN